MQKNSLVNHLTQEIEVVFWNGAHKFKSPGHYDMAFSLNLNRFLNREKIQLNLKELVPSP